VAWQADPLQITPTNRAEIREYSELQEALESAAGRINGKYGEISWTPIRYVNRVYSRSVLAGLYRIARVGLVTPLRDGMNLVAKEYVAAQDPDDPGVIILSRFTGAAIESRSALLVNPYDAESVANALLQALAMPLEERRTRHKALHARVCEYEMALRIGHEPGQFQSDAVNGALTKLEPSGARLGQIDPARRPRESTAIDRRA
jgi:trehalose 6-phosphate synthase